MRADRYSRMVAWLKVILPLAALGILSTLFLLSRSIDPDQAIPFADKEIQDRLRDQQVTGPFFSGTTADGDQLSFSASKLTTPGEQAGINKAEDVSLVALRANGLRITINADAAELDMGANRAELTGGVTIGTSTGIDAQTEVLTSRLSSLLLQAPGHVIATSPFGTLTAGSMVIEVPEEGENAQLLFTKGVKLIYKPGKD